MKTQTNFNIYSIVNCELRFIASFRYWEDAYAFVTSHNEKYSKKLFVSLS